MQTALSTHFVAPEERSFSNCGIHGNEQADKLINEASTLYPPCLFRYFFETPSDFSGTNFNRKEFPLLHTWLLANLGLICSMAKDVLRFLPYLGWRVRHVSESSPDIITCKPICLRLAWLIHRSAFSVNPVQ
ncbi:hypothetical protein TNCV_144601 [Trichonephila clavipes]|nr:hypothetical protein TNCV_144601 [Trichonephila clavipes]